MIIDADNLFSNAQAVTATAAGTNVLDLGPGKVGASLIRLFVHGEAGTGSGTVSVALQSCDTQGGTYTTHFTSGAVAGTALANGYQVLSIPLPADCEQFVKLAYTVSGTFNAKLTAGLVWETPTC